MHVFHHALGRKRYSFYMDYQFFPEIRSFLNFSKYLSSKYQLYFVYYYFHLQLSYSSLEYIDTVTIPINHNWIMGIVASRVSFFGRFLFSKFKVPALFVTIKPHPSSSLYHLSLKTYLSLETPDSAKAYQIFLFAQDHHIN